MKQQLNALFTISLLTPLVTTLSHAAVISTFDGGNDEGWLVSGDATSGTPTYNATGGNAGGYISANDSIASGVWYWDAPTKFTGDHSDIIGGTIDYELQQSNTANQFDSADIIVAGTAMTLFYDTSYNPGLSWTSYSIDVNDTSGWKVGSFTGADATAADINAVFSNIASLRIRGEYRVGADTGGLDNAQLVAAPVPEPSSAFLLGMGGLLFSLRRRK